MVFMTTKQGPEDKDRTQSRSGAGSLGSTLGLQAAELTMFLHLVNVCAETMRLFQLVRAIQPFYLS